MELPGQLPQILRSLKSEFGSNARFSRGVADFPAPVKTGWNLKSRPFKIAVNLSLHTLSCHLSLSVERGLDLMQPHHNTGLQLSLVFLPYSALIYIHLFALVCIMQVATFIFLYCYRPQFDNPLTETILVNTKRSLMHWSMWGTNELYYLPGFCVLYEHRRIKSFDLEG